MTESQKKEYKRTLQQHAVEIISQRIAEAKLAMDNAQEAANAEEKSSAGDKYETSRAMGQRDKEMHTNQLLANKQALAALLSVHCEELYDTVSTGAVVVCNDASFFIAAGLGKISIYKKDIYFLSPAAPVAKLLFNRVAGDVIVFNNKKMLINDVF